jgi:emfourin
MKLTLEIAGGLAPPVMSRRYELDTAGLEAALQQSIDAIVRAALDAPHRDPGAALRDARSYDIRIEAPSGDRTLVVYDGAIPPAIRTLIDTIQSLAPRRA